MKNKTGLFLRFNSAVENTYEILLGNIYHAGSVNSTFLHSNATLSTIYKGYIKRLYEKT